MPRCCCARTIRSPKPATAAAPSRRRREWLLDNYYLVERQVHDIHTDLPPGYYRQLPKLASGLFAGFPRVFALAWTFVADCDSRIDPDLLCRFIEAYQQVTPLSIGELWALAITLRIVLIENLRRLAEQVQKNHQARRQADGLADRLLGTAGTPPEAAQTVLDDLPMPAALAVQLIYRLRDQDPQVTPALAWLDQRLSRQGVTADTLVAAEHLRQGAATVTVQNIITSMRLIGDVDWTQLIERISLVDQVLAGGSDFAAMDFPTRNLYRSAVEDLARVPAPAN